MMRLQHYNKFPAISCPLPLDNEKLSQPFSMPVSSVPRNYTSVPLVNDPYNCGVEN